MSISHKSSEPTFLAENRCHTINYNTCDMKAGVNVGGLNVTGCYEYDGTTASTDLHCKITDGTWEKCRMGDAKMPCTTFSGNVKWSVLETQGALTGN